MISDFKVKPAKNVVKPNYPNKGRVLSKITGIGTILFAAGASLSSSGCVPPAPWDNHGIIDGEAYECTPGDLACDASGDILVCKDENGYPEFETMTCTEFCQEEYGIDYVGYGLCSPDDPATSCDCQYDVIDGMLGECTQGDLYCADDTTVAVCNGDTMLYENETCDEWCANEWGTDLFRSTGTCSMNENNEPCDCFYDVLDGMVAECEIGDLSCASDKALGVCEDGYSPSWYKCKDYCEDQNGEGSVSQGCDSENTDNPCLCTTTKK